MPSTHTSLHYHLIFATKDREPVISADWRSELHSYLGGVVNGLDAHPQGIGGVADHVHQLISLKASSSWIREKHLPKFHWQEGYAAFTVSASARDSVRAYIANQEEHHRVRSFREELVEFLEKTGISYDPRYLD